jgi:hypothetical protein
VLTNRFAPPAIPSGAVDGNGELRIVTTANAAEHPDDLFRSVWP